MGLDAVMRGLSMVREDQDVLDLNRPLYDGLYEYLRHSVVQGRDPA